MQEQSTQEGGQKMNKSVGIVGNGYVGKAMVNFFGDHYKVKVHDPAYEDSCSKSEINECDLALVCVPTPMNGGGSCDTSIVEEVFEWLKAPLIIIKSTVPVGTTDFLARKHGRNVVFSPEYCGESTYWSPYEFHTDVKETPFFTFGGEKEATSKAIDFYLPVVGPVKKYNQTTAKAAEMAKYMENSFYATKIAFCNEMYSICESMGIDWHETREAWLSDPRIHPMHTAVFKDRRGFGGKCLPKDLNAVITFAEEAGEDATLLKAVWESNANIRSDYESYDVLG